MRVVVFSKQASHRDPCSLQMFHVEVQILDALICSSMDDFQIDLTESNPVWKFAINSHAKGVSPCLLFLCQRPCDIQFLEIQVCTLSAQSACIGLHAKICIFSGLPTRDAYQNMLPWQHQVEPLTKDIFQMGIASGSNVAHAGRHRVGFCVICSWLAYIHCKRPAWIRGVRVTVVATATDAAPAVVPECQKSSLITRYIIKRPI
mmetsp:Transcript_82197/g.220919  ORF Transcript_82197/g.220919 Transcript_82197/m.220919 type:complete len:204 (+) Transcript_82197:368-979(+)